MFSTLRIAERDWQLKAKELRESGQRVAMMQALLAQPRSAADRLARRLGYHRESGQVGDDW
jgi:hypothetical protein